MRYWCGYLSGVRCKCFAYGSADATATPSSLASVRSRIIMPFQYGLPGCPGKEATKRECISIFLNVFFLHFFSAFICKQNCNILTMLNAAVVITAVMVSKNICSLSRNHISLACSLACAQ